MERWVYEHCTEQYFKGMTVVTNYPLRNGDIEIPAGTKCVITRKFNGFSLKTEPCKACGVSCFITRVEPGAVTEVCDSDGTYRRKEGP